MINFHKTDNIDCNQNYKVSKKGKVGIIFLCSFMIGGVIVSNLHSQKVKTEEYVGDTPMESYVSLDDVNDMNIVINNNKCGENFFNSVCQELENDGIEFNISKEDDGVNVDDCTVVTLDQQYSSGSSTLIFAPFNNSRLGNSDSLAISMKSAFDQNGFLDNKILCGQVGFEEDENGNVSNFVATKTEKKISDTSDVSFVTVSFGTQNINAQWVAKSIENGLARQKCYLNSYDKNSDLIYRASADDSIDTVAAYFETDKNTLCKYNEMTYYKFDDSQAVINPNIEDLNVFDKNSTFSIGKTKTRAY